MTPAATNDAFIIFSGAPEWFSLEIYQGRWLCSRPAPDGKQQFAHSTAEPVVGKRVHIAGTRDADKVELFLDGIRQTGRPGYPGFAWAAVEGVYIGAQGAGSAPQKRLVGQIHQVRISKTIRYSQDFTPQTRFDSDSETLALYHFDEGVGDVLKDSSGNNHHGQIIGAKWIKAAP